MKSIRLFGGHRNQVFRIDGRVKIVWKDGFARRDQIRKGVLLENFVATHTDIKARMLVDKAKPVQEEDGKLVTYFHFVDGEIRYPWSLDEIASAARLLNRLHQKVGPHALPRVGPSGTGRSDPLRPLHLDFARGNVLFRSGTNNAIGVIDFETTAVGSVEQELGRTLSFLLVDTPVIPRSASKLDVSTGNLTKSFRARSGIYPGSRPGQVIDSSSSAGMTMKNRTQSFLKSYGLPYRADDVFRWATRYLKEEDYGNLNVVRDKAVEFLLHSSLDS